MTATGFGLFIAMPAFLRNKQRLQIKSHKTRHHYWSGCKSEARLRRKADTVSGSGDTGRPGAPSPPPPLLWSLTLGVSGENQPGWSSSQQVCSPHPTTPPPHHEHIVGPIITVWLCLDEGILLIKYGWLGWSEDIFKRWIRELYFLSWIIFVSLSNTTYACVSFHSSHPLTEGGTFPPKSPASVQNAYLHMLTAAELTDFIIKNNRSVMILFQRGFSSVRRCSPSLLLSRHPPLSSHPTLPSSFSQSHGSLEDKHPGPPPPPTPGPSINHASLYPPPSYPFILSSLSA